jgi:hypothetical protein
MIASAPIMVTQLMMMPASVGMLWNYRKKLIDDFYIHKAPDPVQYGESETHAPDVFQRREHANRSPHEIKTLCASVVQHTNIIIRAET